MPKQLNILFSKEAVRLSDGFQRFNLSFSSAQVEKCKEEFTDFWKNSLFAGQEFDEVVLSYSDAISTLYPVMLFADTTAEDLLKLNFGRLQNDIEPDYNRIPEIGVVNVFDFPSWIKSLFVIKFPRIILQHESSHWLRGIMHSDAFKLKSQILVHDRFFWLTIVKHNELIYHSSFEYQTLEDIIYYTSFTLQQKELAEDNRLYIVNGLTDLSIDELSSLFKKTSNWSDENCICKPNILEDYLTLCV